MPRHSGSLFLHITDGAPRDGADAAKYGFGSIGSYRAARMQELYNAFSFAGIPSVQEHRLDVPDQRAAFQLDWITSRVFEFLQWAEAEAVLTHPYEGGHPDHDACAFAVHQAVARMATGAGRPVVLEAAFYHAGPSGIETGCFLPEPPGSAQVERLLSNSEREFKQQLLSFFSTQRETLELFGNVCERFRIAPQYDFTRAPHPGRLFYENFPWGITGEEFRALASKALSSGVGACP